MIKSYANIKFTEGLSQPGICSVKLAPREWLLYPIEYDFNTGTIVTEILLQPDFNFIELNLVPDTFEFEEKPKSNKGGTYYEVSLQGNLNNITPELLLSLETLRNHELVVILKDRRKRSKVIGDQDAGMNFRYANKEDNSRQGGLHLVAIDLTMDAEKTAIFYDF